MMSTPPPYRNFVNRRCVPDFQHGKVVTLVLLCAAHVIIIIRSRVPGYGGRVIHVTFKYVNQSAD